MITVAFRFNRLALAVAVSIPLIAGAPVAPAQELPPANPAAGASMPVESVPVEIVRSAEERLDRIERLLDSQSLVQMLTRIEQLQQELQQLRGEIELQTHNLTGLQQRQRELYLDMDRRLRRLETSGLPGSPGTTPAPGAVPPVGTATPKIPTVPPITPVAPTNQTTAPGFPTSPATGTPAVDPAQERKDYQMAFNLLKEGRYEESISSFSDFLQRHPSGSYADNAQYWLGEVHYVSRNFKASIENFHKVLESHPDSPKVADAMLKLGYARYELGEWSQARAVLEDVIQKYPGTTAARLANKRLERLVKEGR